ncbi:probable carboxylesterase 2 [Tanacetum coccineum]
MALGDKLKLGFIDGTSPKPAVVDGDYQRFMERIGRKIWPKQWSLDLPCGKGIKQGNQSMRKDSRNDGKNDNRGYPDWYKGKKNKKGKMAAQVDIDFSNEVFCGRYVLFHETVFPFKQSSPVSASSPTAQWPNKIGSQDDDPLPCSTPNPTPELVVPNTPEHEISSSEDLNYEQQSSIPTTAMPNPIPPARRTSRASSQPVWLKDFVISKHKAGMATSDNINPKHPIYPLFQTLPSGNKAISSKWVYKVKFFPNGTMDKYKARLVKRGFNQKEGLHYKHTFSQVVKSATIRVLIAIATAKGWPLHQLDVDNAFLHGFVDEEIYMKPPEGYTKAKPAQGEQFIVVMVYVDDILITGNAMQVITDTKKALDQKFTIKDLGLARYFLGLTIDKLTPFPLLQNLKLALNRGNLILDAESYRRLVGRLLYLSMTRTDISYVVQHLSQFFSSPKEPHLQDAMHLLRYLKGSINKGLFYPVPSNLKCLGRLRNKLQFLDLPHELIKVPITLFCDNKTAQQIAANPCYHERTKHLDIGSHFTRDKVQEGFLQTAYIPTSLQLADIMTKALGGSQHSFLSHKLGFQDLPT